MRYNPALDGIRAVAVFMVIALASCNNDQAAFRIVGNRIESDAGWRPFSPKPLLLTFDDGPGDPVLDASILATLRKHHARSVWFITCKNLDPAMDADAVSNRATLRRIAAEGHQLANHGYGHLNLTTLPAEKLAHEIGGCSELIESVSGVRPRYFRPPWGVTTPAADVVIHANGMQVVEWGQNSYDSLMVSFKQRPATFAPFIAASPAYDVARNAQPGDVLLLHDYPNTALALDGILTRLEARGFVFVAPD